MSLKAKEYLGFEVLEGEVGNSFYGSRLDSSFRCVVSADRGDTETNCQILFGFLRGLVKVLWSKVNNNDKYNVIDNGNDNINNVEVSSMGDYWVSSTDLGIKKKGLFTFLGTLYELWVRQRVRLSKKRFS